MQDMQSVNKHALASVPIKHPHKLQQICPALIKYPHEIHQTVVCCNQAASRKPFICLCQLVMFEKGLSVIACKLRIAIHGIGAS